LFAGPRPPALRHWAHDASARERMNLPSANMANSIYRDASGQAYTRRSGACSRWGLLGARAYVAFVPLDIARLSSNYGNASLPGLKKSTGLSLGPESKLSASELIQLLCAVYRCKLH
jgi:hypothetical protein